MDYITKLCYNDGSKFAALGMKRESLFGTSIAVCIVLTLFLGMFLIVRQAGDRTNRGSEETVPDEQQTHTPSVQGVYDGDASDDGMEEDDSEGTSGESNTDEGES